MGGARRHPTERSGELGAPGGWSGDWALSVRHDQAAWDTFLAPPQRLFEVVGQAGRGGKLAELVEGEPADLRGVGRRLNRATAGRGPEVDNQIMGKNGSVR